MTMRLSKDPRIFMRKSSSVRSDFVKNLGMLISFLVLTINGMTFCLIAVLLGFFSYLNDKNISLTPIIEVMVFIIVCIIITSLSFR